MTPAEARQLLEYAGMVAGALVSMSLLLRQVREPVIKHIWTPIRKRITTKGDLVRMIKEGAELRAKQHDDVMHQLLRNGGGSLRDGLDRLELSMHLTTSTIRMFLDGQDIAMFHADADGRTIWVNGAYLRWTGRQFRDVMGYGWMACIPELARDDVREEWDVIVAEQREFNMHYPMIGYDGNDFIVDCVARPIFDIANKKVLRWVGEIRARPGNPP